MLAAFISFSLRAIASVHSSPASSALFFAWGNQIRAQIAEAVRNIFTRDYRMQRFAFREFFVRRAPRMQDARRILQALMTALSSTFSPLPQGTVRSVPRASA